MARNQCTKDYPYSRKRDNASNHKWDHDAAHEVSGSQVDGCPGGDIVRMKCDNCGLEWETELPQ